MKKSIFFSLIALFSGIFSLHAQTPEVNAVKKVITAYAKAGDNNDAPALERHLDKNYRIVMNRLFGSTEVSIIPRSVYLEKIRTKEFGGDKRKLTISNVLINGTTASAQVTFAGSKMTAISIMVLVQDAAGEWKVVSDVPVIK